MREPVGRVGWYTCAGSDPPFTPDPAMRALPLLALLSISTAASAAAQAVVVPVRCHGACPAADRLPDLLELDSVSVWAHLEREAAITYVDHTIRNPTAGIVDAAFFFPLPDDAVLERVHVQEGDELEVYNEWSGPDESRWILEGIVRERPDSRLRAYAGMRVVHIRIPSVPARGTQHLQIAYRQPLRAANGTLAYRYPLSLGAGVTPVGDLRLGMTVKTEAGFRELHSPSHPVEVHWGTEPGPCPLRARCGSMSVASYRVRVVRLQPAPDSRARDFEVVYTPDPPQAARNAAWRP